MRPSRFVSRWERSTRLSSSGWSGAFKLVVILLQAALVQSAHAEGDNVPQSGLKYDIEVELDPARHRLVGRERIHFENKSRAAVSSLDFHLYLNAFRDTRSVFMREGGARLRGQTLRRPGSLIVTALRSAQGLDLAQPLAVQTELVRGDFTQLRVRLPLPVQPGAALDIELEFHAELPRLVARAGFSDDFFMLGQWFPKLAKLGDDGRFVSFPYRGFGEFYADFADYTFTLRVPNEYKVAASGDCQTVSSDAKLRTERCRAEHVHDVAWAAYPYFVEHVVQVAGVTLKLYGPRGYGPALSRQARVLAQAMPYFEERYGPYPYRSLSAIIPPREAYAASGMEYPTLFTSGGPWWALPSWLPDPQQDIVSIHELAHQWFSGMLASNEEAHPFLDEGLAQWTSLDFLQSYYASPPFISALFSFSFGPFQVLRAAYAARPHSAPSSLLSAERYSATTLAHAAYVRPALVLDRIAERRGLPQLTAAVSRYAKQQRFRHPAPKDLYAAFDSGLGPGWGNRVLKAALEGSEPPALAIAGQQANRAPSGWTYAAELWTLASSVLGFLGP
ncbi:MAG TPA: M1 family metallopeptidase [Polyangiales bacterium]|nr:M1 family metallopeptidase [Polyangiales bacterium]